MQAFLRRASLGLFTALALFLIWFGVTYATVENVLWFHAAAVPEEARAEIRPLYFALMNLIGASSAALGLLSLYVIALPLRRGMPGAAIMLALVNVISFMMAAVTAEELAQTGAPTSWHIMGVLLAINAIGYMTHALARLRGRVRFAVE
ncbi:MAG: hypothetical protein AB7J28_16530 [Hyphomonadaceae bacterium]